MQMQTGNRSLAVGPCVHTPGCSIVSRAATLRPAGEASAVVLGTVARLTSLQALSYSWLAGRAQLAIQAQQKDGAEVKGCQAVPVQSSALRAHQLAVL